VALLTAVMRLAKAITRVAVWSGREGDGPPCWKYALESTGFDPLVGSDGFDPLWCKSPNGPQML
jgi:hypothetical protein